LSRGVYRKHAGDRWRIRRLPGSVAEWALSGGVCAAAAGVFCQALQKTYSANKMQEETLKDLQLQLKQLAPLQEAGTKLESETAKTAFLAENTKQAEMTAAMCRQEAAAAVREKENQIWQHQQALERAREDVDELQRVVKEREGVLYQREMKLVASAHEMRSKLQSTSERLNEREKSIHWLAERKRLDNEQHAYAHTPPPTVVLWNPSHRSHAISGRPSNRGLDRASPGMEMEQLLLPPDDDAAEMRD
jgi:chromosome segregation ATPase